MTLCLDFSSFRSHQHSTVQVSTRHGPAVLSSRGSRGKNLSTERTSSVGTHPIPIVLKDRYSPINRRSCFSFLYDFYSAQVCQCAASPASVQQRHDAMDTVSDVLHPVHRRTVNFEQMTCSGAVSKSDMQTPATMSSCPFPTVRW